MQRIVGRTADDKTDLPLLQIFFDVSEALVQEDVVAQVGVGKIRDGREVDQNREIQGVGNFYRYVERGIIQRSFRSLHPVDNAFSVWRGGSAAPDENSGVGGDFT